MLSLDEHFRKIINNKISELEIEQIKTKDGLNKMEALHYQMGFVDGGERALLWVLDQLAVVYKE